MRQLRSVSRLLSSRKRVAEGKALEGRKRKGKGREEEAAALSRGEAEEEGPLRIPSDQIEASSSRPQMVTIVPELAMKTTTLTISLFHNKPLHTIPGILE